MPKKSILANPEAFFDGDSTLFPRNNNVTKLPETREPEDPEPRDTVSEIIKHHETKISYMKKIKAELKVEEEIKLEKLTAYIRPDQKEAITIYLSEYWNFHKKKRTLNNLVQDMVDNYFDLKK